MIYTVTDATVQTIIIHTYSVTYSLYLMNDLEWYSVFYNTHLFLILYTLYEVFIVSILSALLFFVCFTLCFLYSCFGTLQNCDVADITEFTCLHTVSVSSVARMCPALLRFVMNCCFVLWFRSLLKVKVLPAVFRSRLISWTTCWAVCSQISINWEFRRWLKEFVELVRNLSLDRYRNKRSTVRTNMNLCEFICSNAFHDLT